MGLDASIIEQMKVVVGEDNISTADFITQSYAKPADDFSYRIPPDAVVVPKTTEQVSGIVKLCNEYKIPILPRGNGSDLSSGSRPPGNGCIVMDLKKMDKIEVDTDSMVVNVQAGASFGQLRKELNKIGWWTTYGPANNMARIGGALSCNSVGGGGECYFRSPGDQTTGVEVVLADGTIVRTGAEMSNYCKPWYGGRYLAGPDLTGLFIGDPGMLGIKTRVSFRIQPMPSHMLAKSVMVPAEVTVDNPLADVKVCVEIYREWEKLGSPGLFVTGIWDHEFLAIYGGYEFFEPYARAVDPGQPVNNATLVYVVAAKCQEELDYCEKTLDGVLAKYGCKEFGQEIKDGNYARWLLEKTGNTLYAHPAWGAVGGTGIVIWIADIQWSGIDKMLDQLTTYYQDNLNEFQDVKMGFATQMTVVGGGVKFLVYAPTRNEIPEFEEEWAIRRKLHRGVSEIMWKNGALPIWTGYINSPWLVEAGIVNESYMKLFKTVKDALDPNGILSPGKFHINDLPDARY